MVEYLAILLMMVFALLAIHSRMLSLAVIHLAVLSLVAAFLYLLYAAPELAIAEAAIGSGLVTLLYLAALKRNKVYTVAVLAEGHKYRLTDAYLGYIERNRSMREILRFFKRREYETQVVFSEKTLDEALAYPAFDLIIKEEKDGISAHGSSESYVLEELELLFMMHRSDSGVSIVRHEPPRGRKEAR